MRPLPSSIPTDVLHDWLIFALCSPPAASPAAARSLVLMALVLLPPERMTDAKANIILTPPLRQPDLGACVTQDLAL
jgi:hypothetical protein